MVSVGTTHTRLALSSSTRLATGRMLPLLGSTITSSEARASTAATSSAIDGFIDWPPAIRRWTPSERKIRPMPSPLATATTLVTGVGPSGACDGPEASIAGTLADPTLLFDLLHQVGDPDGPGAAGVQAGLDGRADLVGVDVAVPQPVAADHHDGVAEAGPHLLEGGDGLVGCLQEVHHLVTQAGQGGIGLIVGGRSRRTSARPPALTSGSSGGTGMGRPSSDGQQGVEEQQESGAAGVDHTGLFEHGKERGRQGRERRPHRPGPLRPPPPATLRPSAAALAPSAAPRATVRMVPSTGRMTASRARRSAVISAPARSWAPGAPSGVFRPSVSSA